MKWLLITLLAFTSVSAEDKLFESKVDLEKPSAVFSKISKDLSSTKYLTADFTQVKKIKALKRPLKSSGRLTLSSKLGVHWHLQKPYESIIIINDKKMSSIDDSGKKVTFTADDKPIIYNFTRIFMSIFTGKTNELQEHFDLYFEGDETNWRIGLTPKSSQLAKIINKITLVGKGKHVNSLTIVEGNSDSTEITFKGIKTPTELSDKDTKKFDF